MSMTLTAEPRARLDKHLDAVEAALVAAGNSREQRRAVLDDLEAQILDMLAARSQTPTVEDVEAVLAELDPPAAYIPAAAVPIPPPKPAAPVARPRYSRTAIWGLVCILVSLLPLALMIPVYFFILRSSHSISTDLITHQTTEERADDSAPVDAPSPIPSAGTPASSDEVRTEKKTYAEFLSMLTQRQFAVVVITSNGPLTTLAAIRRTTPDQPIDQDAVAFFATVYSSTFRQAVLQQVSDAAATSGTKLSIAPGMSTAPEPTEAGPPATRGSLAPSSSGKGVIFGGPCLICFAGPLGLLGTVLGWIAFFQIRGSKGALRGAGLALFDGLFYPVGVILLVLIGLAFG